MYFCWSADKFSSSGTSHQWSTGSPRKAIATLCKPVEKCRKFLLGPLIIVKIWGDYFLCAAKKCWNTLRIVNLIVVKNLIRNVGIYIFIMWNRQKDNGLLWKSKLTNKNNRPRPFPEWTVPRLILKSHCLFSGLSLKSLNHAHWFVDLIERHAQNSRGG